MSCPLSPLPGGCGLSLYGHIRPFGHSSQTGLILPLLGYAHQPSSQTPVVQMARCFICHKNCEHPLGRKWTRRSSLSAGRSSGADTSRRLLGRQIRICGACWLKGGHGGGPQAAREGMRLPPPGQGPRRSLTLSGSSFSVFFIDQPPSLILASLLCCVHAWLWGTLQRTAGVQGRLGLLDLLPSTVCVC